MYVCTCMYVCMYVDLRVRICALFNNGTQYHRYLVVA